MDATISTEEVTAALGNLPSLEPRPNAVNIRALRVHIERALQLLPCPQSVHHGWKGLAMSRAMYTLLVTGGSAFRVPTDPGPAAVYTRVDPTDVTPLTRTEQATIDASFAREKHYFQSYTNITRVLYAALRTGINEAFQVSNIAGVTGWPASMQIREMLDQLSSTYGLPTPAALELNDIEFRRPYSAADAPEVLFRRIENCAEIAIIGGNPYTDRQIVVNTIRLLLTTGLYIRMFEEWDRLDIADQTWIELRRLIQESFQRRLNATAPTAGGHGYAPAFHNAFGALEEPSDDDSVATAVASQVAALTYQSQLTANTAATASQRQEQQIAQLAAVQDATHATLHQIIDGLNAVAFNVSDVGGRNARYGGGRGGGRNRAARGGRYGGRGRPMFHATMRQNMFPSAGPVGGVPSYRPPAQVYASAIPTYAHPVGPPGGQFGPPGGQFNPPNGQFEPPAAYAQPIGPQGGRFIPAMIHQGPGQRSQEVPYSNTVKRYRNWNACYSCGFDIADNHTSMLCPPHLRRPTHDVNFTRQNAQQYIDLGHPCSTRGRHKTQMNGTPM